MSTKRLISMIIGVIVGIFALGVILDGMYIIDEGHVGVIKRAGKATHQVDPGFHFKAPIVDSVVEMEIRERLISSTLTGATQDTLPFTAVISVNWIVQKESVLDIYRKYGGLAQFEQRILQPKIQDTGKAQLAKFNADLLIKDRTEAGRAFFGQLKERLSRFPITLQSPQIENIELPKSFMEAVSAKEKARQDALREQHVLAQQKLIAQQQVQTAEAQRDALKAQADGVAYKTRVEAEAKSDAINMINDQLIKSPLYIEYVKANNWNGALPRVASGDGQGLFIQLQSGDLQ